MGASVGKTVSISGVEVRIDKQVGEGGFADIFLATDTKNKRKYAVKRMSVQRDDSEKIRVAKWEFQLNQRMMKHPHLVSCEGAQLVSHPNGDSEFLLLLEYCDGGTLLDWIQSPEHATRKESDVLHIFRQLAAAVAVLHAHSPPVRHQDLKPENLLQTAPGSGVWKLCDYGSSTIDNYTVRSAADRVTVGRLIDKNTTPSYRAPEMVDLYSNAEINQAADLWALGVVLYTMLFREQPFPDGALGTLSGKFHVPENHRWSKEIMELLSRLLTKDPTKRMNIVQLQQVIERMTGTPAMYVEPWSMMKAGVAGAAAAAGGAAAPANLAVPSSLSVSANSSSRNSAVSPGGAHSSSNASPSPSAGASSTPTAVPQRPRPAPAVPNGGAAPPGAQRPAAVATSTPFADDDFNPSFPDPTPSPHSAASVRSPQPNAAAAASGGSSGSSRSIPIVPARPAAGAMPAPFVRAPTGLVTSPQSIAGPSPTAATPQSAKSPPMQVSITSPAAGSHATGVAGRAPPATSPSVNSASSSPVVKPSTAVPKISGPLSLGNLKIGGAARPATAASSSLLSPAGGSATSAASSPGSASSAASHKSHKSEKAHKEKKDKRRDDGGGGSAAGSEEDEDEGDDGSGGGSGGLDDRAQSKLVKKLTKDDVASAPKSKHLARLVAASWTHRPEVASMLAHQASQHQGQSMDPDQLARHMLAWEGLPALFAALGKRPCNSSATVAFKSLLLIHRVLQGASPPVLGQVYVHRRFLEELEASWTGDAVRSQLHLSNSNPATGLIGPYAKHLLHRLAFHQLHPHYEGSMSLGHWVWSLARAPTWPAGWALSARLARDDVHHLLQLMAEALRLAHTVLDAPEQLAACAPAAALKDSALDFRHLALVPLLDDLYAMFRAATFMLVQLCLVLGVRPPHMAPHGWPRGIVTKAMIDAAAQAAAAQANASSPPPSSSSSSSSSLTPPAPPTLLVPLPRNSPQLLGHDPHPLDADVPLDSPPENPEEEQVLRSLPTLLSAHKTILDRMHSLFGAASARSATLRAAQRVYGLPLSLHAFQPVPPEYFPPPSTIPATGVENAALCARFQAHNLAQGLATKHRSLALPSGTFMHALPPPLSLVNPTDPNMSAAAANAAAATGAPSGAASASAAAAAAAPTPSPTPSAGGGGGAIAAGEGDEADEETPEERARRKEAKRLKKEAKRAKHGPTAANANEDEPTGQPPMAVVLTPFQHTSSATPRAQPGSSSAAAAASASSNSLQPPASTLDPFASPSSPLYSPEAPAFGDLSAAGGGGASSSPIASSDGSDDPFASGTQQSIDVAADGDDPFATAFASFPTTSTNAKSPVVPAASPAAASSTGTAKTHSPFSPVSDVRASPSSASSSAAAAAANAASSSAAGNAASSSVPAGDIIPFQSDDDDESDEDDQKHAIQGESEDEEDGSVLQLESSSPLHSPAGKGKAGGGGGGAGGGGGRVRTEADYLAAAGIKPKSAAEAKKKSSDLTSPFDDDEDDEEQEGKEGSSSPERSEDEEEESSSDDDDDEGGGTASDEQWGRQQDDAGAGASAPGEADDETPFNDDPPLDPFSEPEPHRGQSAAATTSSSATSSSVAVSSFTPFDDTPHKAPVQIKSPFDDDVPHTPQQQQQRMPLPPPAAAAAAAATKAVPEPSPFDEEGGGGAQSPDGNPFGEDDAMSDLVAPSSNKPGAVLGKSALGGSSSSASSSSSALSAAAAAASRDELLPDEIEFEELQFEERIGIGAYAEVYSGQWRGTDVAIKRLHANIFQSVEAIAEFRGEVQLLRTLRHPHLLLFMAACTRAPNLCVVTELLATSLFDLLHNSDVQLHWRAILQIACDVAKGMSYLHLNKSGAILHRDLKSPNILLDSSRRAKVCDFGLAKTKGHSSSLAGAAGTVSNEGDNAAWMAPEVMAEGEYHEAADVYSFGIIMHELCSREIPYKGQSAAQISVAVLTRGARPPIPANCPAQYSALMQACWSQEPANRPPFPFIVDKLNAQLAECKKRPMDYKPA